MQRAVVVVAVDLNALHTALTEYDRKKAGAPLHTPLVPACVSKPITIIEAPQHVKDLQPLERSGAGCSAPIIINLAVNNRPHYLTPPNYRPQN